MKTQKMSVLQLKVGRAGYSIQQAAMTPEGRAEIEALAAELRSGGMKKAIKVAKRSGSPYDLCYETLNGHRRYIAARSLSWSEVDVIVIEETDEQRHARQMREGDEIPDYYDKDVWRSYYMI